MGYQEMKIAAFAARKSEFGDMIQNGSHKLRLVHYARTEDGAFVASVIGLPLTALPALRLYRIPLLRRAEAPDLFGAVDDWYDRSLHALMMEVRPSVPGAEEKGTVQ